MNLKELREKDVDGLRAELLELRQAQFKLKMQKASGEIQQTHQFRQIRRDIARVKTLLAQQNVKV